MVTIDYRDLLTRLGTGTGTTARQTAAAPGVSRRHSGHGRPGTRAPARCSSPGPSPPPPSARSPATPTSSPSSSAAKAGSWTSAAPPGSSRPTIRKALTARDQGCAFPGCTIPAPWCEAHHITYWSRGGTTSTDNGALLCSHHHHLIHKEQWTIQSPPACPGSSRHPTSTPAKNPDATTTSTPPNSPGPHERRPGAGRGKDARASPGPPHGDGRRPGTRGVRRVQDAVGKTLCQQGGCGAGATANPFQFPGALCAPGGVKFLPGGGPGKRIAMLKDKQVGAVLPAADIARARDFYRDKLGLEPENPDAEDNLQYKCGGGTGFLLYQTPNAGTAKNTQIGWMVDDLAGRRCGAPCQGSRLRGIRFPGSKNRGRHRHHSGRKLGGVVPGHRGQHPEPQLTWPYGCRPSGLAEGRQRSRTPRIENRARWGRKARPHRALCPRD